MTDHIRALEILVALDDDHGVCLEGYERDALKWAIDQLRWRRVDEVPNTCGWYLVIADDGFLIYAEWRDGWFSDQEGDAYGRIITPRYWRPLELPEDA